MNFSLWFHLSEHCLCEAYLTIIATSRTGGLAADIFLSKLDLNLLVIWLTPKVINLMAVVSYKVVGTIS